MNLIDLFERLAKETWERVRDGNALDIRLGETGITDFLLLDIKRANPPNIRIIKTPHQLESTKGTDWEWWIGSPQLGWLRYAVQAKKLYIGSQSYSKLSHRVGGIPQVNILENYSNANKAIPLFCFYNFCDWVNLATCWQCNLPREDAQLGCTVSPSFVVRQALIKPGCRTFEFIHSHPQSVPWRCLIKCPLFRLLYQPQTVQGRAIAIERFKREVYVYQELPPEFAQTAETDEFVQFSPEYYSAELDAYPKRVMVIDLSGEEAVPVQVETDG